MSRICDYVSKFIAPAPRLITFVNSVLHDVSLAVDLLCQ